MKVGVIGLIGGASSERLADALARLTGFRCLIDVAQVNLHVTSGTAIAGGLDITSLDGLIVKKVGPVYTPDLLDRLEVLRFLAEQGLPVFSHPERIMRALNRLSCTVTLRLGEIPMPETVVTEDVESALAAVERFGRAVFKPLYSTKARGMTVIAAQDRPREEILQFKSSGNPVMYIQKMVAIPGRDLGVVFLGGEYLGTYARVAGRDSWNTTIHSGGRYEAADPSPEILALARKAQGLFGLDFTCVDVVETAEGPLVFEVSAFGGFTGLTACGIDASDRYARYVISRIARD